MVSLAALVSAVLSSSVAICISIVTDCVQIDIGVER